MATEDQNHNLFQPFAMAVYLPVVQAYCTGDVDTAANLAKALLQKPDISSVIRAHCHMVLGALGECGGHMEAAQDLFAELEQANDEAIQSLKQRLEVYSADRSSANVDADETFKDSRATTPTTCTRKKREDKFFGATLWDLELKEKREPDEIALARQEKEVRLVTERQAQAAEDNFDRREGEPQQDMASLLREAAARCQEEVVAGLERGCLEDRA